MGQKTVLALLATLVLTSFPVVAQNSAPAANDVPVAQCELHVWPSQGLRSVYYGWVGGGINDGAVTGRKGYPVVPSDPINTAQQVRLMQTNDLPARLGVTGYQQIVHDVALGREPINGIPKAALI